SALAASSSARRTAGPEIETIPWPASAPDSWDPNTTMTQPGAPDFRPDRASSAGMLTTLVHQQERIRLRDATSSTRPPTLSPHHRPDRLALSDRRLGSPNDPCEANW